MPLAAPKALLWNGSPLPAVNVSVAEWDGTLVLVGNGFGSGENFGDIVAFEAHAGDPYDWTPLPKSGTVLLSGGTHEDLTPTVTIAASGRISVYFTENLALKSDGVTPSGAAQQTETFVYTFTNKNWG